MRLTRRHGDGETRGEGSMHHLSPLSRVPTGDSGAFFTGKLGGAVGADFPALMKWLKVVATMNTTTLIIIILVLLLLFGGGGYFYRRGG